jgi:hypothetical protein
MYTSLQSFEIHDVESIGLRRNNAALAGDPNNKWVEIRIVTRTGVHLEVTCLQNGGPTIPVIDETTDNVVTQKQAPDAEEPHGPAVAPCAETADAAAIGKAG